MIPVTAARVVKVDARPPSCDTGAGVNRMWQEPRPDCSFNHGHVDWRQAGAQAGLSLSLSLCLCALASLAPRVVSRLPRAAPLARSDRGRAMM